MKTPIATTRMPFRLVAWVFAVTATIILAAASVHAGPITTIASTIPSNGDVNPYGVSRIPASVGSLTKGNILVSNFNNSKNLQGTGTTIVQISPTGAVSLFAQIDASHLPGKCPGGVGLTTALVTLRRGWVVVGSLPTKDGTSGTAKAGCLLVLDSNGKVVETFAGSKINGPWDMTAFDGGDRAALFFTNVLNGTLAGHGHVVHKGTVVRLDLRISRGSMPKPRSITVIGSGFAERTDPGALVIGPTGLGLSRGDRGDHGDAELFVADSLNNRVVAIDDPLRRDDSDGTGKTITKGGALNDPLGLTVAPNGNVLTVNGGNGFLVETRVEGHHGRQIRKVLLDNKGKPPGAGALFGLTAVAGQGVYFVDDNENALNLFH